MKNKTYLDIEQPINNEEFSMLIYDLIANAPVFDINLNYIPKPKEARFKTYILDLFFKHYTLVTYVDFEEAHGVAMTVNDANAPEHIKNKAVVKKTELLRMDDYNAKKAFFDDLAKTLGREAIIVKEYVNHGSFSGYKDRPFPFGIIKSHDNDYYKDLLDKDNLWENKIKPKVDEAIRVCHENESNKAREKFRAECIPDKKKFADALVVYCEIFRDITDVHKYIDHCLAINRWIKGEPTQSHLLCIFNTDNNSGRNGKTWRLDAERQYMEKNGFITSSLSLKKEGCSTVNDFSHHLYYKDEYDFRDSDQDLLKSINLNICPKISVRVMYGGNQEITNEALIYLCCHNGIPSERIISSSRTAFSIRTTDALYKVHKNELVNIYMEKSAQKTDNSIYYEDLFDGLIKSATDYNHDKVKTGNEGFKISSYLLDVLNSNRTKSTINHLIGILEQNKFYNREKSRYEFYDLYKFLSKNYPEYIITTTEKMKNWNEKSLDNIDGKLLELLETVAGLQTVDVSDELLDKQILRNYIYSLFDLDPNAPVENTTIVDHASNTNKTKQWLEECIDSAKQSSTGI